MNGIFQTAPNCDNASPSILTGEQLEQIGLEAQGADGVAALAHLQGLLEHLFELLQHLSDLFLAVVDVGVGAHLAASVLHPLLGSACLEPPVFCTKGANLIGALTLGKPLLNLSDLLGNL